MAKRFKEADTIDQVLQQVARTREELSRLTIGKQDPEITLTALSVETYLVNKSILALRETLLLSLSWSECRTAENQWLADAILCAISTTLFDILKQIDEYEHPRSSKSSFRLLSREKPKAKTAGLQASLDHLREQNSAFQCVLNHFEMKTDETTQMVAHCRSMLKIIENNGTKSLGQHSHITRPLYVANSITPSKLYNKDLISSYRLTRELQSEGVSMEHILDIYRKSNLKPFMIRDIFRRWRTYGDTEGYKTMLTTLVDTGCDIVHFDMQLSILYKLGRAETPRLLGIIQLGSYNLARTCAYLPKLLILIREEPEWARGHKLIPRPRELPAIPIGNLDFIIEAIRAFDGDVLETHREFRLLLQTARLTQSSIRKETAGRYLVYNNADLLSPRDILHASNMVLELWRHNGFDRMQVGRSRKALLFDSTTNIKSVTWNILVYLHVLRRCSYPRDGTRQFWSSAALFLTEGDRERLEGDTLWIATCSSDPNPFDKLCIDAANLIRHFLPSSLVWIPSWISGESRPYLDLMERYNYSFARIDDIERTLREIFPPVVVNSRYHWIWFALNDFDLEITKADAAAIPAQFPKSPDRRISMIKEMHRDRSLRNMKYTWLDVAEKFRDARTAEII